MHNYYVYMMANKYNGVLYIGMTNNLERRVGEHKSGLVPGFSQRYKTIKLVYYEHGNDVNTAIAREKQLKGWLRKRKNELIETMNPEWLDLSAADNEDPSLRSG